MGSKARDGAKAVNLMYVYVLWDFQHVGVRRERSVRDGV